MTNAPLKTYGFNYEYKEKEYAFDVVASSYDEATARVAAMSGATFFGELKQEASAPQSASAAISSIDQT
ncbi:MAG: hypothetical protein IV108_13215 [Burkholderiales bacterium]|nr:hypothetical protein [Burkholderiales bacterium]